jgi:hypothetical protein
MVKVTLGSWQKILAETVKKSKLLDNQSTEERTVKNFL